MKIKKKYSTILFAIFMALAMSFTISLILTIINTGIVPLFVEKWMRSFAIGFIVALIGQLGAVVNNLGWSTVVIYLFLAVGFGYFHFKKPATKYSE